MTKKTATKKTTKKRSPVGARSSASKKKTTKKRSPVGEGLAPSRASKKKTAKKRTPVGEGLAPSRASKKEAAKKRTPVGEGLAPSRASKKKTAKKTTKKKAAKKTKKKTKTAKAKAGALDARGVQQLYDALAATIVPRSDLEFETAFELLVAVVLSAQATDVSVNEATQRLYPVANTPEAIVELGVDGLKEYIKHIGLYNNKAKNVISLCEDLIEKHGSAVPADRASLEDLAGVGRKSANVVLNIAFGQPTIAVDTHVHRVSNRTGIVVTSTPEQTEQILLERTPQEHLLHAHHYLILHGRYCCKARKPECGRCPIVEVCRYDEKVSEA